MDQRAKRLIRKGLDGDTAEALVAAGYPTPKRIKAAKDGDLTKIPGVGQSAKNRIREVIG